MAKKKKAALKPNPARGFATTSVPSKRPEPAPEPEPAPAAAAAEAPAQDADAPPTARPGAAAEEWDPASAEEMALQSIVERVWERAEKETSRNWKVSCGA
jgi:ATP-dependent RNA helicase DHX29